MADKIRKHGSRDGQYATFFVWPSSLCQTIGRSKILEDGRFFFSSGTFLKAQYRLQSLFFCLSKMYEKLSSWKTDCSFGIDGNCCLWDGMFFQRCLKSLSDNKEQSSLNEISTSSYLYKLIISGRWHINVELKLSNTSTERRLSLFSHEWYLDK